MTYINQNIPIVCDAEIISKIKEMIIEGLDKLKTFVKVKQPKFDIYHELEEKFNSIALKLEKYELFNEELDYFLTITDKILYIIRKNCEDSTFGYCDFALELFDFFMKLWDSKTRLIKNFSHTSLEHYKETKRRLQEYRKKFYLEIHESTGEFDEKEIYRMQERLME